MLKSLLKKYGGSRRIINSDRRTAVILHGHIFKNAGSTFDWSLKRNFGGGFLDHRQDNAIRQGGKDYLENFLNKRPKLLAVSSHHMCHLTPEVQGAEVFKVYFFRHPIARVRSVYDFEKRQPEKTPGSVQAKVKSFQEYVEWRLRPEVSPTIRDYQFRYLLPAGKQEQEKVEQYCKAVMRVVGAALIGVVERYDESAVVIEEHLKEAFPDIDLSYVMQNVSQNANPELDLQAKINEVKSHLGDVASQLMEKNALDLVMYEYANRILDEKIASIEEFDEKLDCFRNRCKAHKK